MCPFVLLLYIFRIFSWLCLLLLFSVMLILVHQLHWTHRRNSVRKVSGEQKKSHLVTDANLPTLPGQPNEMKRNCAHCICIYSMNTLHLGCIPVFPHFFHSLDVPHIGWLSRIRSENSSCRCVNTLTRSKKKKAATTEKKIRIQCFVYAQGIQSQQSGESKRRKNHHCNKINTYTEVNWNTKHVIKYNRMNTVTSISLRFVLVFFFFRWFVASSLACFI